jgi:hypothetical protein
LNSSQLRQGDDSFGGDIRVLTRFEADPQAGGAQRLVDVDIRPEAIGPKQDIAHGCLDLGGNRRHAPGELPLERTDVVVDAERLQMLLLLPGECFTRPTRLLEENQGPHGAKRRSCRPFERAMRTVHDRLPHTALAATHRDEVADAW